MSNLPAPIFHNLPRGRLCVDGGKPVPASAPSGYLRDPDNPRVFVPLASPDPGSWLDVCQGIRESGDAALSATLDKYQARFYSTQKHCWVPAAQAKIRQAAAVAGITGAKPPKTSEA